jgi:hypothetical protein
VFLLTCSLLAFQIIQTRILSVIAWYYMAFFAISVAMLGMTVGAVWVYLHDEQIEAKPLSATLTNFTLATAVAMPASVIVQFCLTTAVSLSLITVVVWSLVMIVMAVPYVFSGIVVSLALTRSSFPTGQVYGVDLMGAAVGCLGVILFLNILDAPSAVILLGAMVGVSAISFSASTSVEDRPKIQATPLWRRPVPVTIALAAFALFNAIFPFGVRPILVKDTLESSNLGIYEKWNTYSRIRADRPSDRLPFLWSPSPLLSPLARAEQVELTIDGDASTTMVRYDGTPQSVSYLADDLVGLAYRLPGIHKSAVVGVGGGRDVLTAHYFGVPDITGVELNPIFINLLTRNPFYKNFAEIDTIPNLKLHVDDARSWFASTHERFDLVQMSMIDTWAATGAGAFTLSENGLYTLEGWRAFLRAINDDGIFTVSRWYNPSNVDETGRMIGLATAALIDAGAKDPRAQIFVANGDHIATLVLSKAPFTEQRLEVLRRTVNDLGFHVLVDPDRPSQSPLLNAITESRDRASLDRALGNTYLDLSVSTDNRPFFFNQLRFLRIPELVGRVIRDRKSVAQGTMRGNLIGSAVLLLILFISIIAVITTILVPLRHASKGSSGPLVIRGSLYFSLIGMGFMLAEIALLQRFSVYLGHPIYSLSVSLFSLILSSGIGSLVSDRLRLNTRGRVLTWAVLLVAYILISNAVLPVIFLHSTGQERMIRILISISVILPLGFLLGFAFPTGIRLVESIDPGPTPWFWGINGATGVLASVLGVIFSITLGINVTMILSSVCYLMLIPAALVLLGMRQPEMAMQ